MGRLKRICIVGIGNILYTDDGAGVYCVRELKKRGNLPAGAEVLEAGTDPYAVFYSVADDSYFVMVDAVLADSAPGQVIKVPLQAIEQQGDGFSMHGLNCLYMLHRSGYIPQGVLIGICPAVLRPGLGLSGTIKRRLPCLVRAVETHVKLVAEIYA